MLRLFLFVCAFRTFLYCPGFSAFRFFLYLLRFALLSTFSGVSAFCIFLGVGNVRYLSASSMFSSFRTNPAYPGLLFQAQAQLANFSDLVFSIPNERSHPFLVFRFFGGTLQASFNDF